MLTAAYRKASGYLTLKGREIDSATTMAKKKGIAKEIAAHFNSMRFSPVNDEREAFLSLQSTMKGLVVPWIGDAYKSSFEKHHLQ
jgi:hypothetical protein